MCFELLHLRHTYINPILFLMLASKAKPGPSRQLATIPFLNGMKNTNKKKRVEGLTSTGRSISTMNGRSNKVDSATSLAESTQATTRNKALTSKNRGTFEREEDACRSPLPRKKVQSVAANSSPSQLRSNGPFLPPGSDKVMVKRFYLLFVQNHHPSY